VPGDGRKRGTSSKYERGKERFGSMKEEDWGQGATSMYPSKWDKHTFGGLKRQGKLLFPNENREMME